MKKADTFKVVGIIAVGLLTVVFLCQRIHRAHRLRNEPFNRKEDEDREI